jgi:glycosyltransferase involved in cell wall biosynthesis
VHVLSLLKASPFRAALLVGEDGPLVAEARALGVPTTLLPLMGSRWDLRCALRLGREIARIGPGLVHAHGTRCAFLYALARRLVPGLPGSIYTEHGLSHRQELSAARQLAHLLGERVAVAGNDQLICVARIDRDEVIERGWKSSELVHVIPNGIDCERFAPDAAARARVRGELSLQPGDTLVGIISRLVPQKAVQDGVRAILAASCDRPEWKGVVVGSGPQEEELRRFIDRAGAGDRARVLGEWDDIRGLLSALDIYLLTSRWEGLPIGLLEAMATGVAVVATATEGAAEVITDGVDGRLVPLDDEEVLAGAIGELAGDGDLRRRLGENARGKVLTGYGEERMVEATFALYKRFREDLFDSPRSDSRDGA